MCTTAVGVASNVFKNQNKWVFDRNQKEIHYQGLINENMDRMFVNIYAFIRIRMELHLYQQFHIMFMFMFEHFSFINNKCCLHELILNHFAE